MELLGATTTELEHLAKRLKQPSYRGRQIAEWLYKKGAESFDDMTNLPAEFRREIQRTSTLYRSKILDSRSSKDGTTKYLLELSDGQRIESVLIPYEDRVTVCVSTQVGCAAECVFCATAVDGFIRNMTAGEIVDQVLTLQKEAGQRVTNVVFMGMGEPLLNYDAVLKSVRLLNDEVGIAMRKITISTVGITPYIRKLQSEKLQLTLAISLHSPDNILRCKLIPLAKRYPLGDLITACRDYANATSRRVTYEYLLIAGINDSPAHAKMLLGLLKSSLANLNLIPYNEVHDKPYKRPLASVINVFREIIEEGGVEVTQRFERGHSLSAACGQLRAG